MSYYGPDPAMDVGYEFCRRCREEPVPVGLICATCEDDLREEQATETFPLEHETDAPVPA